MIRLAVANVFGRKLRSGLSMLAVAIATAMLIVMLSLTHGMLNEVAARIETVGAELIVLPKQDNVIFTSGAAFSEKMTGKLAAVTLEGRPVAERVVPVLLDTAKLGGQQQRVYAVDPDHVGVFFGARRIVAGSGFQTDNALTRRLAQIRRPDGGYDADAVSEAQLADGCQLVIDSRLARAGRPGPGGARRPYEPGDTIQFLGRTFRIVGVVEAGVAGRVFCPLQTLRHIKLAGARWSTMYFVKLAPGVAAEPAADALAAASGARVELKSDYGQLLYDSFSQIYTYINIANAVALVVCFIIILLTMYTMVLERTRQTGVLKALGASRRLLVWQTVTEAIMICWVGTAAGVGLAVVAAAILERVKPLLTVTMEPRWLLLAAAIGTVGGVLSALYPGYRAARLDPARALAYE